MTAQPRWEPTDNDTADLLSLVADTNHVSADYEWKVYLHSLSWVAGRWSEDGYTISPNRLREEIRGRVAPRRIGAFTNRALRSGLIAYTGEWEVSDDTEGRNAGKPCRVMRWLGTTDQRAALGG